MPNTSNFATSALNVNCLGHIGAASLCHWTTTTSECHNYRSFRRRQQTSTVVSGGSKTLWRYWASACVCILCNTRPRLSSCRDKSLSTLLGYSRCIYCCVFFSRSLFPPLANYAEGITHFFKPLGRLVCDVGVVLVSSLRMNQVGVFGFYCLCIYLLFIFLLLFAQRPRDCTLSWRTRSRCT